MTVAAKKERPVEERVKELFKPLKLESASELDVVTSKKEINGYIIVRGFNRNGLGVLVVDNQGNVKEQDFRVWPSATLRKSYEANAEINYNSLVEDFMEQIGIGGELERKYS